ncbi:hypothetical protein ACFQIA_11990 [Halalkalicoccus sp. GCM10025704]
MIDRTDRGGRDPGTPTPTPATAFTGRIAVGRPLASMDRPSTRSPVRSSFFRST